MMLNLRPSKRSRSAVMIPLLAALVISTFASVTTAHPLGNFTINHFARLEVGQERVHVHYIVDMAEIPTFQELQAIDVNGDGATSDTEFNDYVAHAAAQYAGGILLTIDGAPVALQTAGQKITTQQGTGGLQTLRVECEFAGTIAAGTADVGPTRRFRFEDTNYRNRTGWREIVVVPADGVAVFDSTAFGNGVTDELKAYPQDMLSAPIDERVAELSFTRGGLPAGATALRTRDGRPVSASQDRFAALIAVPDVTPAVALLGLLIAAGLGALHAFSPGHGKTVVGAYLVGSRGTARHAAFLGLTVTITHTLGVFALGVVTLFASQYILPERLFPILSLVSGAIVVAIGLSLFVRRLRAAASSSIDAHHDQAQHEHDHSHGDHTHDHVHGDHSHPAGESTLTHSHGGKVHSHLPPGADGSAVTWRSLLALGVSGGLLPCPSALVVLLSAISLHRVGYGMFLVVAFSAGLACTLTAIGLAFVYAGRWMKRPLGNGRLVRILPTASALVVTCVGLAICYEALVQGGFDPAAFINHLLSQSGGIETSAKQPLASIGALAILGLGLVFGLKHATEVDHVVAVSTIVSEHRNILRAALVGGLWGAGHTISLIIVGVVVLALRVAIPDLVASWLEFGVALMIIGLGVNAFTRALRRRSDIHIHQHRHDGTPHAHIHFHDQETAHAEPVMAHSHAVTRIGIKPLLVGAMHGLAGSAALTLLVLTQIGSPVLGLLYLAVFGLGSIVGMLLMSGLVALPFIFSARKLTGVHYGLQAVMGVLSIAFGFWYAYETGIAGGLFGSTL
jgi:nickel/cobalt transporter (NicO) family protein